MTFGSTEFYKYVSFEIAEYLENYLNQKIYFAPVKKSNDPFEAMFKHYLSREMLKDEKFKRSYEQTAAEGGEKQCNEEKTWGKWKNITNSCGLIWVITVFYA